MIVLYKGTILDDHHEMDVEPFHWLVSHTDMRQ